MKRKWISLAAMLLMIGLTGFLLFRVKDYTPEQLMQLAPQSLLIGAVWLWLFYGLKTLSIFFPSAVLQIGAGLLFPLPMAILVNSIGMWVCLTLGYVVGQVGGSGMITWIKGKYPKAQQILGGTTAQPVFTAYMLRVVACLPMDVVSMAFGALRISYGKYLLGSLLGILPITIAVTVLGTTITRPGTPTFWGAVLMTVAVSAISWLVYRKKRRETL